MLPLSFLSMSRFNQEQIANGAMSVVGMVWRIAVLFTDMVFVEENCMTVLADLRSDIFAEFIGCSGIKRST